VPAPGNALLPARTPAPSAGPEPRGGRLLQEVPLLLAGQRQVSAFSEVLGVTRRMSVEVLPLSLSAQRGRCRQYGCKIISTRVETPLSHLV
jgi:hypothetical protein